MATGAEILLSKEKVNKQILIKILKKDKFNNSTQFFSHISEQAVDEFIHAQILTKASQANEIITVVIVTGDGNDNEGFSNFIRVLF